MEITPDPGPLLAAAIVAAVAMLDEQARAAAAVPAQPALRGRWVASGAPRAVSAPSPARRPAPRQRD